MILDKKDYIKLGILLLLILLIIIILLFFNKKEEKGKVSSDKKDIADVIEQDDEKNSWEDDLSKHKL